MAATVISYHPVHRTTIPITPTHSAQNSQSSQQLLTPGQLSLHEYRKQQATPSPPAVKGTKQVRRKRAASGLNSLEHVPSVPRSPFEEFASNFHVSHQISRSENVSKAPKEDLHSPSFVPLPEASRRQPFHTISPNSRPLDYSSTDEAENFYRSHSRYEDFSKNSKPIKKLPKRPPDINQHLAPSPLRSTSSASPLISSAEISISKFPRPPSHAAQPLSLGEPVVPPNAPSLPAHTEMRPTHAFKPSIASTSSSPAVVHYRGASFDLVNPHQSLQFSRIETPADAEVERTDYFHVKPSRSDSVLQDMATRTRKASDAASSANGDRRARILYADLPSAHHSIANRETSRSAPGTPDRFHTPPTRPSTTTPVGSSSKSFAKAPLVNQVTPTGKKNQSSSLMRKVSNAFNRRPRAKAPRDVSHDELQDLTKQPQFQREEGLPSAIFSEPAYPAERDIEVARHGRVSLSDSALGGNELGYYEDSQYGDSSHPFRSSSVNPESEAGNSKSAFPPFAMENPNNYTDYSGEGDGSYIFGFSNSRPSTQRIARSENASPYAKGHKENTLEKIIGRYGNDTSYPSLGEVSSPDNSTVRLSSMPHVDDRAEGEGLVKSSSGLSQFDFEFGGGRSDTTSPSASHFPRQYQDVFTSDGSTPAMPTISLPASDSSGSRTAYPAYYAHSPSKISQGSSYTDTHRLLFPSEIFSPGHVANSRNNVNLGVHESAQKSSPVLPQLSDSESGSAGPSLNNLQDPSIELGRSQPKMHPAMQRVASSELKRLSDLSMQSNLTGKILLVTEATTPDAQVTSEPRPSEEWVTTGMSTNPTQEEHVMRRQGSLAAAEGAYAEAMQRNQTRQARGIPDVWSQRSPGPRLSNVTDGSYADVDDEGEEGDWVTDVDYSRNTLGVLPREPTGESLANYSSSGSFSAFLGRPGDDRNAYETKLSAAPSAPQYAPQAAQPYEQADEGDGIRKHWYSKMDLKPDTSDELLEAGPNEEILYEEEEPPTREMSFDPAHSWNSPLTSSSPFPGERENSFHQLTILGPKGNLTGTPQGTGMRDAGSSLANTSSPGMEWSTPPAPYVPSSSLAQVHSIEGSLGQPSPVPRDLGVKASDETIKQAPERVLPREANRYSAAAYHFDKAISPVPASPATSHGRAERPAPLKLVASRVSDASTHPQKSPLLPHEHVAAAREAGKLSSPPPTTPILLQSPQQQRFAVSPKIQIHHPSGSSTYSQDLRAKEYAVKPLRPRSRTPVEEDETSPLGRSASRLSKRASVQRQTQLKQLKLKAPSKPNSPVSPTTSVHSQETHFSQFVEKPERTNSSSSTSPLTPLAPNLDPPTRHQRREPKEKTPTITRENIDPENPHLVEVRPTSSIIEVQRAQKQRLSWLLFGLFVWWFPPFAILYGFGAFDGLIAYLTNQEVRKCGDFPKRIAKWYGCTTTLLSVIAIAIILALHAVGKV